MSIAELILLHRGLPNGLLGIGLRGLFPVYVILSLFLLVIIISGPPPMIRS